MYAVVAVLVALVGVMQLYHCFESRVSIVFLIHAAAAADDDDVDNEKKKKKL